MTNLDQMLGGLIPFLKTLQGVQDAKYTNNKSISDETIMLWERKYARALPRDLKEFYKVTDGMNVTWFSCLKEIKQLVGKMDINPIELLKPIDDEFTMFLLEETFFGNVVLSFNLDHKRSIYLHQPEKNEFIPICDNFTQYFRLSVCSLCIIGWQTCFGNPLQSTLDWMCFYCPKIFKMLTTRESKVEKTKVKIQFDLNKIISYNKS